jgi:hypothetical protein
MKLSYTIFPKAESPITFQIAYSPSLDNQLCEGFWDIDSNKILLSLKMYREFNKLEKANEKIAFFNTLQKISKYELTN